MIISTSYIGVKDGKLNNFHIGSYDTGGEQKIVMNWTISDEACELIREHVKKQKACGMM